MAIYDKAVLRLLPENETQPRIDPRVAIAHTAVDAPGRSRLWAYFGQDRIKAETHFYIENDGTVTQMMDTNVEADANQIADKFAVSYETEDDGDPEGNPWTPAQLESIIELNVWLIETHPDILPEIVRHPRGNGLGWHSMWGFKNPLKLEGRQHNPWTNAFGKTCPGRTRINQFVNVVVPAVQDRLFGEDMFDEDARNDLSYLAGLFRSQERWDPQARLREVDEYLTGVGGDDPLHVRLADSVEAGVRAALGGADTSGLTPVQVEEIVDRVVTGELRKLFKNI